MNDETKSAESKVNWGHWLTPRLENWRSIEGLLSKHGRTQSLAETRKVLVGYRAISRDVALARRTIPGSITHRTLEALYVSLFRAIHQSPRRLGQDIISFVTQRVPLAARRLRHEVIVVTGLFLASAMAGVLLITQYPDTASLFLSAPMMETVQQGRLWTDGIFNVMPSSILSIDLMMNNITVALTCLVLGFVYGLGTLYIICLNGLMLGAVFAYTARFDLAAKLFRFVVAHGIVELSVICLAGAAGLSLGRAIARPGINGRVHSVRVAMRDAGVLAAIAVPFLIGSGIIEGYVSPHPSIATSVRVVIGLSWFLVLLAVLDGRCWRRGS